MYRASGINPFLNPSYLSPFVIILAKVISSYFLICRYLFFSRIVNFGVSKNFGTKTQNPNTNKGIIIKMSKIKLNILFLKSVIIDVR